ncbi:DUF3199 family protein [Neobacillus sp. MM2021_6]|uniref:DUF3199 family protein n=1 Tax=Bacillaceae TaxID=186817 RepID=UPI00140BA921|nr:MULTISPECIES: DUF3199 family protein [Bacillaceae]MBO0962345.1 DUF3199 family protein [Neobacillus sp. MM2021_6]NHC20828.1 DUF3199 family protein [Bacillus sp. MM2020_4]
MYANTQEVKDRTSFPEVAALTDEKITGYIERSESWLHRAAGRKFRDETDPDMLADLRTATILLVEYLWYQDNPDVKEDSLSPIDSEKIGSYSYTAKKVQPGESTGIPELDSIIDSLKVQPVTGISFFAVSGPSGCEQG